MCTWLSLDPQNLHLFMLRKSHGALVDTSKLCWHWTPHILGKRNFGGSKFFEPYAHERQKAAEIPHFAHSEKRKHCALRSKNEDPHCLGHFLSCIWSSPPSQFGSRKISQHGLHYEGPRTRFGGSLRSSRSATGQEWKPVASDGGVFRCLKKLEKR